MLAKDFKLRIRNRQQQLLSTVARGSDPFSFSQTQEERVVGGDVSWEGKNYRSTYLRVFPGRMQDPLDVEGKSSRTGHGDNSILRSHRA